MKLQKLHLTKNRIAALAFGAALAAQAFVPFLAPSASAGALTNTLVRFDRLAQSQSTGGMVCAKPATASVEAHVQVTFPGTGTQGANSFGVNSTAGNWTTTTTNLPSGASAWLGIGTATAVSGATVTFPSTDLVVGTLYCFNFASSSTLSTPTSNGTGLTGSVTTQDSGPATIDTGNYGVQIVGANLDQITVSATVNPTFSMALSSPNDALSTLAAGSVTPSPTPRTATVNTNAANGWYLFGKDSASGLNSATASNTISTNCSAGAGTNTTLSAGTAAFNTSAAATSQTGGTGTVTIAPVFVGGSLGRGGGLCSTNYQTVASSSGSADTSIVTLTNNAAISNITKPASDYQDIETFVGAGLF
jgi:hypothetical protein